MLFIWVLAKEVAKSSVFALIWKLNRKRDKREVRQNHSLTYEPNAAHSRSKMGPDTFSPERGTLSKSVLFR